jgi:hypothetical protein
MASEWKDFCREEYVGNAVIGIPLNVSWKTVILEIWKIL